MEPKKFISREKWLSSDDTPVQIFESAIWGGAIQYKPADLLDKAMARQMAETKGLDGSSKLDPETLTVALIRNNVVEPRLEPEDIETLKRKNARELERLANAILGPIPNVK